jgi:hypothetical protein
MFGDYIARDLSLSSLAADLNERQVPTPSGRGRWGKTTVLNILRNNAYAGCYVWGKVQQGRYYRCDGGEVAEAGRGVNRSERQPPNRWLIIPGAHEPLVELGLFDQVQERLAANRLRTSNSRKKNLYPLSGLLVCQCGSNMYGTKVRSGGVSVPVYRCGNDMSNGGCSPRQVREAVVLKALAEVLQEKLLNPENLEAVRAALQEVGGEQDGRDRDVAEDLRKKVARLGDQISRARGNLSLLDPSEIADARAKIRELQQERDAAEGQLAQLTRQSPANTFEGLVERVHDFVECVRQADRSAVRALLRETIDRVELRFNEVPKKKVTRYPLTGGVVHFLECGNSDRSLTASTCTSRSRPCPTRNWRPARTALPAPACASRSCGPGQSRPSGSAARARASTAA